MTKEPKDQGEVIVSVNGRKYAVSCDPGQEKRLAALGEYLEARVSLLAEDVGQIGDLRLLLMASLLVSDELADSRERVKDLERRLILAEREAQNQADSAKGAAEQAAKAVSDAAERVETLAARASGLAASA